MGKRTIALVFSLVVLLAVVSVLVSAEQSTSYAAPLLRAAESTQKPGSTSPGDLAVVVGSWPLGITPTPSATPPAETPTSSPGTPEPTATRVPPAPTARRRTTSQTATPSPTATLSSTAVATAVLYTMPAAGIGYETWLPKGLAAVLLFSALVTVRSLRSLFRRSR